MHRKRIAIWTLVVGVAALGMIFATAAGSSTKVEPYKVAWIYPGPHNDDGWAQAHDAGRLYVMKKLGSRVQTTYKENVFSNAQVPQIVAGLVRDGYKMIFGCSFGNFSRWRQRAAVREVPRREVRAGDGNADQDEPVRVLRRRRGHDLPFRAWRPAPRARRA